MSKILRIKDLTLAAGFEGVSFLGMEMDFFWLTDAGLRSMAGRLRILQFGVFEILSQGCSSQGMDIFLWMGVEKFGGRGSYSELGKRLQGWGGLGGIRGGTKVKILLA